MSYSASSILTSQQSSPELPLKRQASPWPESPIVLIVVFYMGCSILRPWEVLWPVLGLMHFERILAVVMIAAVASAYSVRPVVNVQSLTIGGFLIALGLSSIFAARPELAWVQFYKYCTVVAVYIAVIMAIKTVKSLIFVLNAYIFTMTIYLAKSQWEFFFHGRRHYRMGVGRLLGIENTLGGPNELAMSIIASLPFLFFLWVFRREITAGWSSFWQRWHGRLLIVYAALALSSIVLTNSRSGMMAFIVFMVFAVPQLGILGENTTAKTVGGLVGAIVLLGVLWLALPKASQDRFRTIWDPDAGPRNAQVSAQGRVQGLKAGLEMFQHFPVTGVGPGNFIEYRMKRGDGVPLNAHNLLGQALGETGLLGTVTFLLMIGTVVHNARKLKRIGRRSLDRTVKMFGSLSGAIRASVYLLLIEGLFGHNLLRFNWLWLGAFACVALVLLRQHVRAQTVLDEQQLLNVGYPSYAK